jgi:hypothetical protein
MASRSDCGLGLPAENLILDIRRDVKRVDWRNGIPTAQPAPGQRDILCHLIGSKERRGMCL